MNCKNSIGILSVIIILLCGCQPDKKTTFTAASYNLRNANSADSVQGDGWGNRCPIIARLVQFHEFDIFGTQEGLRHQLDSLKTSLPKYDYIGVGRNDGKKKGEHAAIFYRIDKFELLEHGDFWLSETPEKPSVGWDAVLPRICTWGHFKYKDTGFEFLFFNLHMDHIGKQARGRKRFARTTKNERNRRKSTSYTHRRFQCRPDSSLLPRFNRKWNTPRRIRSGRLALCDQRHIQRFRL